jgi:hypothetical protein
VTCFQCRTQRGSQKWKEHNSNFGEYIEFAIKELIHSEQGNIITLFQAVFCSKRCVRDYLEEYPS